MKLSWTLSLALTAMLLTACETLNFSQYQVVGTVNQLGVRAAVSPADQEAVKQIVSSVAAQFKLVNMTASSLVPNIVAYYTELDVANPIEIKVYTSEDKLVVDLMQSSTGGETSAFRDLKDTLVRELTDRFGDRLNVTPTSQLTGGKVKKKTESPKKVVPPSAKP